MACACATASADLPVGMTQHQNKKTQLHADGSWATQLQVGARATTHVETGRRAFDARILFINLFT